MTTSESSKLMKPQLTFTRECVRCSGADALRLDEIQIEIAKRNVSVPDRNEMAEIVNRMGMIAYRGGRHVSIHSEAHRRGGDLGDCVATITGNFGDWI